MRITRSIFVMERLAEAGEYSWGLNDKVDVVCLFFEGVGLGILLKPRCRDFRGFENLFSLLLRKFGSGE